MELLFHFCEFFVFLSHLLTDFALLIVMFSFQFNSFAFLTKKKSSKLYIQSNLDLVTLNLVTLNLVTTCDLVTILQGPFFNFLHKIIRFSDIMQFSDRFCTVIQLRKVAAKNGPENF